MQYKKIIDIAELLNGYAFKNKNYVDSGIRIIRIANVQDGKIVDDQPCFYPVNSDEDIEKYCLKKGDLLISLTGNVGRVGLLPESMLPAALNQRVSCLRLKDNNVDLKYLFMFLRRKEFIHDCVKASKGVAQLNLSTKWIENYKIPIPELKEQERIVSRIEELFSELDSGIETLKKTKEQLRIYRQAVLKEAFEGKLSNNREVTEKLKWTDESNTSKLPNIPKEWHYISLSKLGDLGRGKSKHRPRNDAVLFENGKYPFIQTGDVKAAKRFVTDYSKMYGEEGLKQSKLWPKGTLCITIAANIAETAFLGIDACFPDSIVGFTPNEYVISEYVKYFIESEKIKLWAFAPATAQKNINLNTLEKLIIPYCTLIEQREIVDEIEIRMSVCENIENTVNSALSQAEALRQSILKEAFEGRL